MISKFAALAAVAAAGLAISVTACGSSPASTAHTAPSPTASGAVSASAPPSPAGTGVPAGLRRIGGPSTGISIAIPQAWVMLHPTTGSLTAAAEKLGLPGLSAAQIVQSYQQIQKLHGVIAFDITPASSSSAHLVTTINAYCISSGVTDTGGPAESMLGQEAKAGIEQVGGTVTGQRDITIGGIPGVETSYTLNAAIGPLPAEQLEVLPKPGTGCFVTLTGQAPASVLAEAAQSAQYY